MLTECYSPPVTGKLSQQQLRALAKRQQAFASLHGINGRWVRVEEPPWYIFQAPKPNPARLRLQQSDLTGLDLRGLDLPCANLRLAVCTSQDLTGARLDGGLLREGMFTGSSFRSASLQRVDFTDARLERCDFTGADLSGAEFENADLAGARINWTAAGRGRYRVTRTDGIATGGYGEMEQDFSWTVLDQKSGAEIAQYDGHSYQCFFSSEPTQFTGVVAVKIKEDARSMLVTLDSGLVEEHPLPSIKSSSPR